MTDLDFPGVVQHDESKKKASGEADQALQDRRIYRILKEKKCRVKPFISVQHHSDIFCQLSIFNFHKKEDDTELLFYLMIQQLYSFTN